MQGNNLVSTRPTTSPAEARTSDASTGAARQVPPTRPKQGSATGQFAYYGYRDISCLCARFITHLFACPKNPHMRTPGRPPAKPLPYFIAYTLHRTKLDRSIIVASLVFLRRLKARFPAAQGSSGHRLFISALMVATKVFCDENYANKSWQVVAQGIFHLRELNQMERELCKYLDWELTVDNTILNGFEVQVWKDFSRDRPSYPNYPLALVSKRAVRAVASTAAAPLPEPLVGVSPRSPTPPTSGSDSTQHTLNRSSSPSTTNTPSPPACCSDQPSSASTSPPQTPVGLKNALGGRLIHETEPLVGFRVTHTVASTPNGHPLKGQMFAFAVPSTF